MVLNLYELALSSSINSENLLVTYSNLCIKY